MAPKLLLVAVALSSLLLAQEARAELILPQIFSDGLVLQTNKDYGARSFIFGTGVPGEQILITGLPRRSANGVPYPGVVDPSGKFRVQLDPNEVNGMTSHTMTVSGSKSTNKVVVRNIVYGDVILCR